MLSADVRVEGRMKFYDAAKSYGYIIADTGAEYFFNTNSFRGESPRKGDRVAFHPDHGPKGLIAKRMLVTASA
jgi:cold shock CspA family protein